MKKIYSNGERGPKDPQPGFNKLSTEGSKMKIRRWCILLLALALASCTKEAPPPQEEEAFVLLKGAKVFCKGVVEDYYQTWEEEEKKYKTSQYTRYREETEDELGLSLEEIDDRIAKKRVETREKLHPDLLRIEEMLSLAENRLNQNLKAPPASRPLRKSMEKIRKTCFLKVDERWDPEDYKKHTDWGLRWINEHLVKAKTLLNLDRERYETIRLDLAEEIKQIDQKVAEDIDRAKALKAESDAKQYQNYLEEKKDWEQTQAHRYRPRSDSKDWWETHRLERHKAIENQEKTRDDWWDDLQKDIQAGGGKPQTATPSKDGEDARREELFRLWYGEVASLSAQTYGLIETYQAARLANDSEGVFAACEEIRIAKRLKTSSEPVQRDTFALWLKAGKALDGARINCQKGRFTRTDDLLKDLEKALREIEKRSPVS